MDVKPAYTMMLAGKFLPSSKAEPDERIAAAKALLMPQKDRKLLVAEIMKLEGSVMIKSDTSSKIKPQVGSFNLKGLTLYELYRRQEMNQQNLKLLDYWLDNIDHPVTYEYWLQFDQLRRKINRAIYLKRLKLWLLSLVGRN